jgi:hypothetical protein
MDAFESLGPHEAQLFLKRLPPESRRKGQALFRSGRVQHLVPEQPGPAFSAVVADGAEHTVYMSYDPKNGWDADCSCDLEFDCAHVFAAMCALVAEQSTTAVRNLSAGLSATPNLLAVSGRKIGSVHAQDLEQRLTAANSRPLTKDEKTFVRQVHEVYLRCRQTRQIDYWDFHQMGIVLFDGSWAHLQIWPALPQSEYEFWLYVANAARERGLEIPEFMRPITDLGLIEEQLVKWRRTREIEKWKQTLGNFQNKAGLRQAASPKEIDLRLVLEEEEARLQWRRADQLTFEPMKASHFRQLDRDWEEGRVRLTVEAELLWNLFAQGDYYAARPQLEYSDDQAETVLGRLLRIRSLENRIVTLNGQPLARPDQRLRDTQQGSQLPSRRASRGHCVQRG